MHSYDVYVANPPSAAPLVNGDALGQALVRGWIQVGADLDAARLIVRAILDLRGNAYVMPAAYRVPRISEGDARVIAEGEHRRLVAEGQGLDPITISNDDFLWWTFIAEVPELVARDVIPGCIRISIDKLDGHISTEEEFQTWLRLSAL